MVTNSITTVTNSITMVTAAKGNSFHIFLKFYVIRGPIHRTWEEEWEGEREEGRGKRREGEKCIRACFHQRHLLGLHGFPWSVPVCACVHVCGERERHRERETFA